MSAVDTFKRFRSTLEFTEEQSKTLSECRRRVISHLNLFFWTNNSETQNAVEFGSFARGTAVFGVSDTDVAFCLPSEIFAKFDSMEEGGKSALLKMVKSTLAELDPATNIDHLTGSVRVSFGEGADIDVRPYFSITGKNLYPDIRVREEWRAFTHDLAQKSFEAKNAETKNNLFFICRAARLWRSAMNVPISGLLIDTLAFEFIDKSLYRLMAPIYHDCLLRDFFGFMAGTDPDQEFWYVPGSTETVIRTGPFEDAADKAYAFSEQAIDNIRNSQDRQAWAKWREIFGARFIHP